MAKSRNRRRGRDTPVVASATSRALPVATPPRVVVTSLPRASVPLALRSEDRRQWHPLKPWAPAAATVKAAARTVLRDTPRQAFFGGQTKAIRAFAVPPSVAICVRRKRRKEVIHALGVAGGKVRKPRRNAYSKISCR